MILRKLAKTPTFSALAILTLALGIAAATAVVGVVDAVLIRPLPYPDADRLVAVTHDAVSLGFTDMGLSDGAFVHYRDHAQAFEEIAAFRLTGVTLVGDGEPESLRAIQASASLFSILRVRPILGRTFDESEILPGGAPVVVLSEGLWRRRFGEDRGILGRAVEVDGVTRQVVGVAPESFDFAGSDIEVLLPLVIDPATADMGSFGRRGLAKLAPGMTVDGARADLERVVAHLGEAFPGDGTIDLLMRSGFTARVEPLRETIVGDVRATLWILLGSVGIVLLIACANVANLFLVRAEGRRREIALRSALGARRGQLAVAALAEGLTVAALAAFVGLLVAAFALRALVSAGPSDLPRIGEIGMDGRTAAAGIVLTILTGVFVALLPVLRRGFSELGLILKDGGRGATAGLGQQRVRRILVAAQVALAVVLLTGSMLLARSFRQLARVDPGVRAEGLLTARITLPESTYPSRATQTAFYDALSERLEGMPGVEATGAVSVLPLGGRDSARNHMVEGITAADEVPPIFSQSFVTPGALTAQGTPLVAGRGFEPRDAGQRSMLVSEAVARRYWDSPQDALGRRIAPGSYDGEGEEPPWYTIVGVVGDVRIRSLQGSVDTAVYYPQAAPEEDHDGERAMTLVLRTSGDPAALAGELRRAVRELDAQLPISRLLTYDEILREARAPMAFTLVMLLIAASTAVLLGAVGIFGTVSYLVTQRTGEIGVRRALGARGRDIRRMVLSQGLRLSGAGIVVGLLGAVGLTRYLESLLFEVDPLDPWTFAAVPCLVLAAALVAGWIPARRASRIDPMVALRHE